MATHHSHLSRTRSSRSAGVRVIFSVCLIPPESVVSVSLPPPSTITSNKPSGDFDDERFCTVSSKDLPHPSMWPRCSSIAASSQITIDTLLPRDSIRRQMAGKDVHGSSSEVPIPAKLLLARLSPLRLIFRNSSPATSRPRNNGQTPRRLCGFVRRLHRYELPTIP